MHTASAFLTPDQRQAVEDAIAKAEAATSAEVVTVIAGASGRYDRAEDVAGLWLGSLAMVLLWIFWPAPAHDSGEWGAAPWVHYLGWLLALAAGFVLGAFIAARVGWLRRLFTPRKEMQDEVHLRARSVFHDQRIHRTRGGTGLLIYVSLYERRACMLADDTVRDALTPAMIDDLCASLTASLARDPGEALVQAIQRAGARLAETLPRPDDDTNELPNKVVVID